jgi:PIN domain nuclease of toxin-antitoxin system
VILFDISASLLEPDSTSLFGGKELNDCIVALPNRQLTLAPRPATFRTKYMRLAQSKQVVLLTFFPSHTLDFDACSAVTEMHDRMIAADALRINATLLTRDAQITSSGVVATVW